MTRRFLVVAFVVLALGAAAGAQDVSVTASVSDRVVYVDVPFELTIRIANGDAADPLAGRDLGGLELVAGPSRRQSFQSVNGRSTSWVDLVYTLVARRTGSFTIPALEIEAGGQRFTTDAIMIKALETTGGDDVFLRVAASSDRYYVGQRTALTLQIWVRTFVDQQRGVQLDARDTWRLVSQRDSSWGVFAEALRNQVTVAQQAHDGTKYYVFELPAVFYPEQAGELRLDDVQILVNYPQRLRRETDFFGRSSYVPVGRPVVKRVDASAVAILPPPDDGRPEVFNGAVGRFEFAVSAAPTSVAVGDPITLTMEVRDRTQGGAALDLLAAPPLETNAALGRDFRLPPDAVGGVVAQGRKTFTQTVRATHDGVDVIPPLSFAYFDPLREEYATLTSKPIPIDVAAVESVSMSEVVGAAQADTPVTELTEVTGGLLANYTDADGLLRGDAPALGWPFALLLAVPPLAFGIASVTQRRMRRLRDDAGYARRRSAAKRARRRLDAAQTADAAGRPSEVAAALGDYVADRLGLPAGALTDIEVVAGLEERGAPEDVVADVRGVLASCEQHRYAGGAGEGEDLASRAADCVRRLEREALS